MSNLTYEQIKSLTEWDERETRHFMPNEIFEDLQAEEEDENGEKKPILNTSQHVAFAYSYYYLTSWLYRYTKYGTKHIDTKKIEQNGNKTIDYIIKNKGVYNIDVSMIKELLGYTRTNKTINYIIKNKGKLDSMGYTETTNNYPILWHLDEFIGEHKELVFTLVDELDIEMKDLIRESQGTNYKIKCPIKHFYRYEEDIDDGYLSGIFYDVSDTHEVGFDVFAHCMSIKELGTNGFYLYGYLKMKNQHFKDGYDVSLKGLSKATGIPYKSMTRYLDALREYNLVKGIHNQEYFSQGINGEDRKANTYITNNSDQFKFKPQPYQKMEVKTFDEHLEVKAKKKSEKVDITLSELPY
ncbi:hypothetical protein ACDI16_02405 [Oceanobacillus caeni]